ncbi:hypothetical protein LJR219_004247 [Phenylobacterium sp. LjRoot219]|uniref:hypothetical protein n=1 Tax=Phenylobacterium sp. LjRoot219 TaxID=3342283 RepID=UPI003ECFDFDA
MTVHQLRTRTTVGVELPAELLTEVETYARVHGILPPEALRYLIEAGLTAEAQAHRGQGAAEPIFWAQNWDVLMAQSSRA